MTPLRIRQGDVLLTRVDRLPAGTTAVPPDAKGRLVLAEGELTGHAHTVTARPGVRLRAKGDRLYLVVGRSIPAAPLTHDEHDPIPLSAGVWEKTPQREYTPEEIRNVAD